MPAVSAVIPTYNRLPLLMEAVASVRAQTFADWELVVADDGSTDGSAEAVEALGDPRIRVLRLPHAGYAAAGRNAGLAAARGEWVAFLDSDDRWEPHKLAVQLHLARRAGVRWSYTDVRLVDEQGRTIPLRAGRFRPLSGMILRELLENRTAATHPTLLVQRALLDEVGRFDASAGRDDYDLVLRLAARAPALAVDQALTVVREHGGRTTRGMASPHEVSLRPYERFLERERDPALRRVAWARMARLLVDGAVYESALGRHGRAAGMLRRSLRYDPPPAAWMRAAASVAARALGLRRSINPKSGG
ncbi:MAG TPA: glycosyltransferase [Longimicrobium sp.]